MTKKWLYTVKIYKQPHCQKYPYYLSESEKVWSYIQFVKRAITENKWEI